MIKKNSKGVLYSILTIFLIAPLILFTMSYTRGLRGYGKELGDIVRIKSGYYFLNSLNEDLARGGEIVGKRSLAAAINYVIKNGEGLDDSEKRVEELFKNGTLYGEKIELMNDTTVGDWLNKTKDLAKKRGFNLKLKLNDFSVKMKDSFHVLFLLNYTLKLKEENEIFSFAKNLSKNISVSIIGLEDPLFPLYTNGKALVTIEKFPYRDFTSLIVKGTRGGNNLTSGRSVVVSIGEAGEISEKDEKILVTDNANDSVVNQFKGIVAEDNETGLKKPYVINSSAMDLIEDNRRIVVKGDEEEVWEIENLYRLWESQSYIPGNGPSFLDRLEGNLTKSSYIGKGIETFVKKEDLTTLGLEIKDKSNVDHIYFSNKSVNNYKVMGMPSQFKIDDEEDLNRTHLEIFEVENLIY